MKKMSERDQRLFDALKERPYTTYELVEVVGTVNVAQYIKRLRDRDIEVLKTNKRGTDRDGHKINYGVYELANKKNTTTNNDTKV